jgi:GNAT superfamily N-acetyltransferase
MKIIKATPQDIIEVLFLLKDCVSVFNSNGLKHWNNSYPSADTMRKAIEEESLYLLKDREVAKGMAVLTEEEPEEYKNIDWQLDSEKVAFVKYFMIHPNWQDKEFSKALMSHIEEVAKEKGYTTLRFDVYGGISSAEKVGDDFGFNKTGQFHSSFQTVPYLAFEKSL